MTGLAGPILAETATPAVESARSTATPSSVEETPALSVVDIERGQRGYGLSVFAGHTPERFEVEVLGLLQQTTPELSYVMARLSGHDLERSGVAGGMSGSPVFIDGKLVGAVAFSYLFGLDAIAGITPIRAMRNLSGLPTISPQKAVPLATVGGRAEPWAPTFEQLVIQEVPEGLLEHHLQVLQGPGDGDGLSGMGPAWTWTAGGFGEQARSLLAGRVGRLHPVLGAASGLGTGSTDTPFDPDQLVGGSAVAALLVEGDLRLAAHGTITERRGDEILAFGHPMFSLGPIQVPMATSEVVTVIASSSSSFKLSNAGEVIGMFDQDREAGVRGRLGVTPPQTPLTIRLRGFAEREYRMRVAKIQAMRPLLMTVATLGALDSGSYSGGYQGIDLELRFDFAEEEDLVVRQSFDGDSAGSDAALHLLSYAAFLEFNPWRTLDLQGVEVDLHQTGRPRSATLVAAHPDRLTVAPGEQIGVHLELDPYRGERRRERFEITIPDDVPDGRYYVFIGGGTSLDAVRLAVEKTEPESLDQALDSLRALHSRRDLVVYGMVARPGLSLRGRALPALPGSVRSIYAGSRQTDLVPLSLQIVHRQEQTLETPIDGAVRLDLQVERPRD